MHLGDRSHPVGSRWRPWFWSAVAAILLAPLVAMRFTSEVNWTTSDFMIAAVLLVGAGLGFELLARSSASRAWRTFLGSAIALAVALVWAQGAVGIV